MKPTSSAAKHWQPVPASDEARIQGTLDEAVQLARANHEGARATYADELALAPLEVTAAAIVLPGGACLSAGDAKTHRFTLQSTAKLITLIALLEEIGEERVFSVVGKEPSGDSYASVVRLETHGPSPTNPLINAGAIALCGQLRGSYEERLAWLRGWTERLYGEALPVDEKMHDAERRGGDHNRAMAYMLRRSGVFAGDVDEVLEIYFALCSLEADVSVAARLPALLARGGRDAEGRQIISPATVHTVTALMTTCGMYDASGAHLIATGMPAKSGVSGLIVATAPGTAGIAVVSPRIDGKGASIRGQMILKHLTDELHWSFIHLLTGQGLGP
ncbi:MAG: glutaminase A [Phycisphaeraceae bacterium]